MDLTSRPLQLFLVAVLSCVLRDTASEVFTAIADLEHLVFTEQAVLNAVREYIQKEEARLDQLKQYARLFSEKNTEAAQDLGKFVTNPVNSFLLVKRLTSDWEPLESLLQSGDSSGLLRNISASRDFFPTKEDLSGAATALFRLQDTYKLETAAIARGDIQGAKSFPTLSAGDCFELGRLAYTNGDYYHTVLWMEEATHRLASDPSSNLKQADVLEYLAYSTFMVDGEKNVKKALKLTNELLQLVPNHQRAIGNKRYYEQYVKTMESEHKKGDDGNPATQFGGRDITRPQEVNDYLPERQSYERLCREPLPVDHSKLKHLKCYNVHNNRPNLFLAPAKKEVVHLDPEIIYFRDAMNDKEIERIKSWLTQSAWLNEAADPLMKKINARIADLTGLEMSTAEELQIANYGIGGHYEPHFDFAREDEINAFKDLGTGNRIATILFYMTDVEAGGCTVFPRIGARLVPSKGAAAFWFNLKKSGKGDYQTRHAACPVLAGSKWVCNKWIHELGQEFNRPCGLTEDE